ncbi:MAG: hypothetical protein HY704_09965 [Gemmatimonadetes bacterium]|nr:hypothetical protein [Gemmatimonadota bacterium]
MAKPRSTARRILGESGLIALAADRALLKRYYADQSLVCTVGCGGRLERVRVQRAGVEGGKALFECQSCSLRYELVVPKATRTERRKVKEALDDGREPECPRHGAGQRLGRIGRDLVCSLCGVAYGRV